MNSTKEKSIGWSRFREILGSGWFGLSMIAWTHSLPTGWVAVVIGLIPLWACGAGCSCGLSLWQRVGLLGIACLAGSVVGMIDGAILHVVPTIGTGFLIIIALLAMIEMIEGISRGQQCRWKLFRAGFLMSWVVSYFIFQSLHTSIVGENVLLGSTPCTSG